MLGYEYDDGGRRDAGYKGDTGDCVVRAIAIASGAPYQDVYDAMAQAMCRHGYRASGNAYGQGKRHSRGQRPARQVQTDVMAEYGFEKVKLPKGPKPTYEEAHARYGDCIVSTTKHVCALVGGALRDTSDGRTYIWEDKYGFNRLHERKAMSVWVKA